MRGKKVRLNKISHQIPSASAQFTEANLLRLRSLINASAEICKDITHITEDLRQVPAPDMQPFIFTPSLKDNHKLLREIFRDCDDIQFRSFIAINDRQALLVYAEGMTDITLLEKNVLEILMAGQVKCAISTESIVSQIITSASVTVLSDANSAIESIMTGNALLIIDGIAEVFSIGAAKYEKRGITEAVGESVIRGSQDAFNETLADNIVLVRRRCQDANVKVKIRQMGNRTKTAVALIYAEDLVKPGLVEEVQQRLDKIEVDKVIFSGAIENRIVDSPWSPFPQLQGTERPDKAVSAIYEGRLAILVDNTPYAVIVPCTYNVIMQTTDDYSMQTFGSILIRFTRHVSALIAVYLPALYVAVVSYNPGILPTSLAITVAELRARTPFPSLLEALIMEGILEIFQEAVIRLPKRVAGAASMVGGFVIGNTIVQAGLINPLLVVVIAATAVASFTMPSYAFSMGLRSLRVPVLVLASFLGLYGVALGFLAITIHMCSLRSFGESYLGGIFNISLLGDWKDQLVVLPQRLLNIRPKEFGSQEKRRGESG